MTTPEPSAPDPSPPLVSVLVRTKERPRLLAEALASLRRQTLTDFEVVLVNDGGPLPEGLLSPAPGRGLRLVSPPPPGGRSSALNAGLAAARGRFLAYLDDDDLFRPEHLETLTRFLSGTDVYAGAYTDAELVFSALQADGTYRETRRERAFGRAYDAQALVYGNFIPLICLMHERAAAVEAGGFDESFDLYEDWDFLIRLTARIRLRHLTQVTCEYRLRDDATNATIASPWLSGRSQEARRRVLEKHADRRTPEAAMALVDGHEDSMRRLGEEIQRLSHVEAARAELERRAARLEDDLRCLRADAARQIAASGERESALRAERDDVLAQRDAALAERSQFAAERDHYKGLMDQVYASRVWRLFTPWWRLRARLRR